MSTGRQPVGPNTLSVGYTAKVVTVQAITADGLTAITTDSQGTEVRVPLLIQRAKGALPQPGETWVITQELGAWTFAAFAGTSAADFSGAAGGAGGVVVSSTAPQNPSIGLLWLNPAAGTLAIWTSHGWELIQIGAQGIQSGAITHNQISPDAGITPGQVSFTVNDLGGFKATFGPTEPVDPAVGDMWFNPDAGYVLTRWDGAEWVQYQFNAAAALQAGTITAVQIAEDAGIDAGQVAFTARDIGGLNTTVSSTPPSSPNAGDLWFDGTNGYRLNQWDGTAWDPVQWGTNAIQAGSVTAALIAANTITAAQIAAGTITATEIAAGTITAAQIAAGSITAAQIAANTITAAQIAANTITAAQIAASTITAAQIQAGTIDSTLIAASAIAAGMIAAGAIDGLVINGVTINAGTIVAPDVIISGDEGGLFIYDSGGTIVKTITEPGPGSFTAPPGVTGAKVECWGPGGSSAGGVTIGNQGGDSGAGGEYSCELVVALTPGHTYSYNNGSSGARGLGSSNGSPQSASPGSTTWFTGDSITVTANPGAPGAVFGGGSLGGTGSTNSIHFPGGNGAAGAPGRGGGGGSSAGPGGPGNPGIANVGGAAVPDGGPGASTGATPTQGFPPVTGPGGGASGGGNSHSNGATGFAGQIRLTYTATSAILIGSVTGAATSDPVNGDPVPEGAYFDNLATDNGITLRTDGTWVNVPPPTGSSGLLRYRKVASPPNSVQIQCHLNFSPGQSGAIFLFTLPAGFIPTNQFRSGAGIFTAAATASGIANTRADVDTDGTVQVLASPSGTSEVSFNEFVPLD